MAQSKKWEGDSKQLNFPIPEELYNDLATIQKDKYSMLAAADIYRMALDQFRRKELEK